MSFATTPRVEEALAALGRAALGALAERAGIALHALTPALAAALSTVRDDVCEFGNDDDDIPARALDDAAENADYDCPGAYLPALRLASSLRAEIREARADECPTCGGTGEAWFDVEDSTGRVVEDMVACGCGGH